MKIPFQNTVDIKTGHRIFRNPDFSYSVSSRMAGNEVDILTYLRLLYIYLDLSQISTVFGSTTEPCDFYGGRVYSPEASLSDVQIEVLNSRNIGLSLTLTNHYYSRELYDANLPFLEKYHRKGNVIICTSDDLARMIRKDFPLYSLRASIIKNLNTLEKVKKAFGLYDDVVIPMDMNDDDEFLEGLPGKDRIMLFANAACAYTCPARTCYAAISKYNRRLVTGKSCTKERQGTLDQGNYFFNVEKFHQMGFSSFKLIPVLLDSLTGPANSKIDNKK